MPARTRVPATPETIKKLIGQGHQVIVQTGAGVSASIPNNAYEAAGATIGSAADAFGTQLILKVVAPSDSELTQIKNGTVVVGIAIAAVVEPQSLGIVKQLGDAIPAGNRLELFLGAAIGAITFSGSVIAFGKLSGKYKFRLFQGAPVQFGGQHKLNLVLACPPWAWAWCSRSPATSRRSQ